MSAHQSEQHLRRLLRERMDQDSSLLNRLLLEEVLSLKETQKVRTKGTVQQRNEKILDYILKKRKLNEFLTTLSATEENDDLFSRLDSANHTGYHSNASHCIVMLWIITCLRQPMNICIAPLPCNPVIFI